MGLTTEQLDVRRGFLGGTDIAALAGLNPKAWAQPIDVFAEKRPDVVPPRPRRASPLMDLGHLFEDPVARMFQAETGLRVRHPSHDAPVRCKDHPWEGGHVDRLVAGSGPLDCKVVFHREDEWGDSDPEGTNPVVPARYLVQVLWYMHVLRREPGWLAVRLPARFAYYRVNPNPVLLESLLDLGATFWRENVLPGVPPEPDGSESYEQFLRRLYPVDSQVERVATPYQQTLLREYQAALERGDLALAEIELRKQALMASMADTSVLVGPGARITWRSTKPATRVDWKAVAEHLAPSDTVLQAAAQEHTTVTEGSRPWRVKFDEPLEAPMPE